MSDPPFGARVALGARPSDSPVEVARRCKGRTSRVHRGELAWPRCRRVLWSKSYSTAPQGQRYVADATVGRCICHHCDAVA